MEPSYLGDLLWIIALDGVRKFVIIRLNWMQLLFRCVKYLCVKEYNSQMLCLCASSPFSAQKKWKFCFLKFIVGF